MRVDRMEVIDELVIGEVERPVITVSRMKALMSAMVERRDADRTECKRAEGGICKLSAALADPSNAVTLGDKIFREQLDLLMRQQAELNASIEWIQRRLVSGPVSVLDEHIAKFCAGVRDRLRHADLAFRKQWLRLFGNEVIVGREEITISGREDATVDRLADQPGFFCTIGAQL